MTEYLKVSEKDAGERLDLFLSEETEISRSRAKSIIEEGGALVNGVQRLKAGYSLKEGDEIEVAVPEPEILKAGPENIPIEIVYQDNDLAIINKPRGMVTHPAAGNPSGTLVNALLYQIKDLSSINGVIRPGIVHRLDKDTSGLIAVAKNDAAHRSLAGQIGGKTAVKIYIALVEGILKEDEGKIEAPIGRSKSDRKKMAVIDGGRYALTTYKVIGRYKNYTLAEFRIFTGRTHQIRVHAKHIGRPVAGDPIYGGPDKLKSGLLLHSYKLEINQPTTGERLSFTAELPDYFKAILEKLR